MILNYKCKKEMVMYPGLLGSISGEVQKTVCEVGTLVNITTDNDGYKVVVPLGEIFYMTKEEVEEYFTSTKTGLKIEDQNFAGVKAEVFLDRETGEYKKSI